MSTSKYYIPPVGTKGVFIFYPPFDKPDIDKQEYEVVEIRKIKTLVDSGEDPFKTIYDMNGLEQTDYVKDLENEVPVITLTQDDETYLYVPASRIKSIPSVTGRLATERIISFGLGLMPDDIDLRVMYDNIAVLIEDTIGVRPEVIETPGGPTIVMPDPEYDRYIRLMKSKERSANKSWRLRYLEEIERNKKIKTEKAAIEKIILSGGGRTTGGTTTP